MASAEGQGDDPPEGEARMNGRRQLRRGQGMVEYIIIVALIAIACIAVVTLYGNNIRSLFGVSADALAGEGDVPNRAEMSDTDLLEKKNLTNFADSAGGCSGGVCTIP
jgi:Flp pilus assembly pilin Flp